MKPFRALRVLALAPLTLLVALGCSGGGAASSTGGTGGGGNPGPKVRDECDPLVPTACVLPFPNDRYLVDGGNLPGKKQLVFPENALPISHSSFMHIPSDGFNYNDGFSTGLAAMTHLPGATVTGLPTPDSITASLEPACPTVLIDTSTGERVPHFSELDMDHQDDDNRMFSVRPVVRLKDATRYVVAIRNVLDADGKPLPATPAFKAFRDKGTYIHPSIEPRRAHYEEIFATLEKAGVHRADLQIAWDFTTATREGTTRWAVKMRDDALASVGSDGPKYKIDMVTEKPSMGYARQIDGHMTVPLFLDKPGTGGVLVLDDVGMPKQNGTADYPFTVYIPDSATTGTPGAILHYGHGLLGSRTEAGSDATRDFANKYNYVVVATDWIGMASDDQINVTNIVSVGDISKFRAIPERSLQGFVNALLAMRLMSGKFAQDASVTYNGKSVIDTTQRFYDGNSQGGILGAVYMALSTDVTRGNVGVNGQPYNLLLNRSEDFAPFFFLLQATFPNGLDRQIALALVQSLWDRAEPTGYSPYVTENMLPNTPKHAMLSQIALSDHQVSNLGAHITARSIGAKMITPAVRTIFGIDQVAPPYAGSAIVEYDFGLPPAPITDIPPSDGDDPHEWPRRNAAARQQKDHFYRTGEVQNFCNGPCKFPHP